MFVHETRYMKFKQIINLKNTIISINTINFRKIVKKKNSLNNFVDPFLDVIQQHGISRKPSRGGVLKDVLGLEDVLEGTF